MNSQYRKLWVSLMVRIHQYVLLLELGQKQNGPTETQKDPLILTNYLNLMKMLNLCFGETVCLFVGLV